MTDQDALRQLVETWRKQADEYPADDYRAHVAAHLDASRATESASLREALADVTAMCQSAAVWPEDDLQGLRYHALEAARRGKAALTSATQSAPSFDILECDQCGAKPSQWGPEWADWERAHTACAHCPLDKIQGCDGLMRTVSTRATPSSAVSTPQETDLRADVARLLDGLYGLHARPGHVDAVLEVFQLHAPVKVPVVATADTGHAERPQEIDHSRKAE